MGLINKEIAELRQMLVDHKAGTVSNSEVGAACKIYSEIEKRERLVIKAFRITENRGEKSKTTIEGSSLIDFDFDM